MSSTRVKLVLERPSVKSHEQCWMLVDKSCCKIVRDLEYMIVKKFFVDGQTIVNLYLDDFLLPSQEMIDVIRDNDVIRVIEEKREIFSNDKSEKTSIKGKSRSSKKRKLEESSHSKTKIKKAKLSPCKKMDNNVQPVSITNKQSSSNIATDSTVTNNATLKEKHKDVESVNKSFNEDSGTKMNSKSESRTKQKKLTERQKKPSAKDKSIAIKWNNFWDKLAGNRQQCNPSSIDKKVGDTESVKAATTYEKDNDRIFSVTVDKGPVQCQTIGQVQKRNEDSLMLPKAKVNKETPNIILNGISPSQGNHIRFDDEENTSADVLNNAMVAIAHPHVLSICGAVTPSPNGTPNVSPIEPNTQNVFHANKSVNGKASVEKHKMGKGERMKDSYTNKSLILESTRVGNETQKSKPVSHNFPEKDYSVYPLLHGPPRVGDTVAYKMIELSQSYTPEISNYKEGKVLSFDSLSKQLRLKLTKESLTKIKGDGNISRKFEILEIDEQDSEAAPAEEISDEVEIQWRSMIEPRLVDAPATE